MLLCSSVLGLQAPQLEAEGCTQLPASLERGVPSLLRVHRPELGLRSQLPAHLPELGIVFFCVLRKETKQTVGAGVSKGSHSRNLDSRFFLHNKATCGSPVITYVHCHICGAGFRSHPCRNLGGGAAVGTGQVKIAGRRNMCPLS